MQNSQHHFQQEQQALNCETGTVNTHGSEHIRVFRVFFVSFSFIRRQKIAYKKLIEFPKFDSK